MASGLYAKSWTDASLKRASDLWGKGVSIRGIAETMGVSKDAMTGLCYRNRDLFPLRRTVATVKKGQPKSRPVSVPRPKAAVPLISHIRLSDGIETVVRVTAAGAKVTLPRVTFIDGPATQAKEGE